MCSMSEIGRISRSGPANCRHVGSEAGRVACVVGLESGPEGGLERPRPDLAWFDKSVTDVGLDSSAIF